MTATQLSEFRLEKDYLGEVNVPAEAYWGVQTQRALDNFQISGIRARPDFIRATVVVKRAAAKAHMVIGDLELKIGNAIVQAADEILAGKLLDQFVIDVYQAGAGTSHNMNANEVLANRAIELLGGKKGEYKLVHPNDHVNMAQSTNDVIPTSMRIAAYTLVQYLFPELGSLQQTLQKKAKEFDHIVKPGRTHLMDAAPIRLGQVLAAYAQVIRKDILRIKNVGERLLELNIGATAVGTGLNADPRYITEAVAQISKITGYPFQPASNLVEMTQSMADFVDVSGALRVLAVDLIKIANDLRLMGSGPYTGLNEIKLPAVQPGSSIMPGKVNPVIAECLDMICFEVIGNDTTVTMAAQAGQLELNVMMPIIAYNMIESLVVLRNGVKMFRERLLEGLEVNEERVKILVEKNPGIALALNPYLGFETTAEIVKQAIRDDKTIREVVLQRGLMKKEELDRILDPFSLTEVGIAGKQQRPKK